MPLMRESRIGLVLACAGLALGSVAQAQTRVWDNPSGGSWFDSANWSPADVPDSTGEIAQIDLPGMYTIAIDTGSPTVGGFELLGPGATVGIGNARALGIDAAQATINGTLVINAERGVSTTRLLLAGPAVLLDGSGQIVLNNSIPIASPRAQIADAFSGQQAIVAPSLTIRGAGIISAGMDNRGLITADVDGFELALQTASKVNDGELRAEAGGVLLLRTDVAQGATGRIVADGGTVRLNDTVVSGELDASTGLAEVAGGNARLEGVSVLGPLEIENARSLTVADGFTLEGELTVNRDGGVSQTRLILEGDQTLSGMGTMVLNDSSPTASPRAFIVDAFSGQTTAVGANLTIRGSGIINAALVNEGLIVADDGDGELSLDGSPKTNNGQLRAQAGGTLLLRAEISQGPAGRIVADGGTLRLNDTIIGGEIDASGGLAEIAGSTAGVQGVTIRGPLEIENARSLTVAGGMTLEGQLLVNREGGISIASLSLQGDQLLDGAGAIVLNDSSPTASPRARIIDLASGQTTTIGPNLTIRGDGIISAALVNEGIITADNGGGELAITGPDKVNTGQMRAEAGGTLIVQAAIDQGPDGRVIADGGTVRLNDTVIGGEVDASAGLLEVANGNGSFEGVALLRGPVEIQNARTLTIAGGLDLEGTVTVNRDTGVSSTRVLLADSQQLTGDGEIFLNDTITPPSPRAAIAHAVSGLSVSFGPDLSITGNGTIGGANTFEGLLSPGRAGSALGEVAAFSMNGPVTLTDAAQVRLQLGGRDAGEFDRIVGSADLMLGGTLEATLFDGFEPDVCENFVVIEGRSIDGAFDTLVPPASSSNRRWRLFYTADTVELRLTCAADIDGDCTLTIFDFLGFQNLFDMGSAEADFDGDGELTLFDFLAFQNQFAAGCS
ncbi:MAG: GC-type dockerin domain-anchored protein [Phycisphaerales bacterium]